jgi:hypothetical protein
MATITQAKRISERQATSASRPSSSHQWSNRRLLHARLREEQHLPQGHHPSDLLLCALHLKPNKVFKMTTKVSSNISHQSSSSTMAKPWSNRSSKRSKLGWKPSGSNRRMLEEKNAQLITKSTFLALAAILPNLSILSRPKLSKLKLHKTLCRIMTLLRLSARNWSQ